LGLAEGQATCAAVPTNHIPYCLSGVNVVTVGFGGKAKPQVLLCRTIILHIVCQILAVVTVGFGGKVKLQVWLSYGQSHSLLSVT
jgi:hypothetical protein